jgi:hypothetical protein
MQTERNRRGLMLGPIDYIVVGFRGNNFDGSIMRELKSAVKDGVIRVVDMVFVIKDAEGKVSGAEVKDQSDDFKSTFAELDYKDDTPLFTEKDIEKVGADMENDTAAGVLVIEQVWAKGLKQALTSAGGKLLAEGRIHPENAEFAMQDLALAS